MKLGMIDYGRGNLRSVINACRALGHDPTLITKPEELEEFTHLIFPGQGAFGDCMDSLNRLGLADPLREWIEAGKPYFGICVGYQLLFESSEESPGTAGLGVFKGQVKRFTSPDIKIPHMGWNAVELKNPDSPFWKDLEEVPYFYFVHSYYPDGVDPDVVAATCTYGQETFCAGIERGALLAVQYHPEKSQHEGLQLLKNFLEA
ncbi:imidazole glycerol phosphate synthase subunit HisH [Akkermansiaceae bacterium]|nr:imidazole glycerol phosphate synthase subunit HisH [Akkermansiaceae bacterium]MDA7888678.1 imidazole glycerol phosphate synthase subunit HisH [Akkermansiaceae bacterium]MDB4544686.1 imidazole glycerol phosphate synthase subunit HisH [Akkermansiaceae bacterium]